MIDLQLSCGLPIKFDELTEQFHYGEEVLFSAVNKVPLSSMLPGLLNKTIKYPETVYLEHKKIRHKKHNDFFQNLNFSFDILLLPSGLMGVEFIHSHIYYAKPQSNNPSEPGLAQVVEVILGDLTVLLQKNEEKLKEIDYETRVSEGLVVRLKKGEKFCIPAGYYHTFINIKSEPVIFSRFYPDYCKCDYSKLKKENGLAYFAIRKNAKQEIVLNPRYRKIPKIEQMEPSDVKIKDIPDIEKNLPLYSQLIEKADMFSQVF